MCHTLRKRTAEETGRGKPSESFQRLSLYFLLAWLGTITTLSAAEPSPQNILFIIGDDIGLDPLGLYGLGPEPPSTPTLDSLAANGVLFRNVWATPLCSPTRAALITGRYGFRTGVGYTITPSTPSSGVLSTSEFTLPKALEAGGAAHALAAIGKWNLGNTGTGYWDPDNPILQGFDYYAGNLSHTIFPDYFLWEKVVNDTSLEEVVTMSEVYATTDNVNDAISWIGSQGSDPWFLWLAFNAAHSPFHKPPNDLHSYDHLDDPPDGSPVPYYKAMIESMDTEIGRLLASLAPDVLAQTTVIFLGDNGTPREVTEYYDPRRVKFTIYQGGVMVPLILSGPSIVLPGREVVAPVNATDLFATILELAGVNVPEVIPPNVVIDSLSIVPYLEDPDQEPLRRWIFSERFLNGTSSDGKTVRTNAFKLMHFDDGDVEFYDLVNDPLEWDNLANAPLTPYQQSQYDLLAGALENLPAGELPDPQLHSFVEMKPDGSLDLRAQVLDHNHAFRFNTESSDDLVNWSSNGNDKAILSNRSEIHFDASESDLNNFYRVRAHWPGPPPPPPEPGSLFGADATTDQLLSVSSSEGYGLAIGAVGFSNLSALALDINTGGLYGIDISSDILVGIDRKTGSSTSIGPLGVDFPSIAGLAFNPDSNTLFATSGNPASNLYSIDTDSGRASIIGSLSIDISGLAYSALDGNLYGSSGQTDSLYSIDLLTASTTLIGQLGIDIEQSGLAFAAETDGLYLSDPASDQLYLVSRSNGTATPIGPIGFPQTNGLTGINAEPRGLFGSDVTTDQLIALSTLDASAKPIGELGAQNVSGLAMDANTGFLYGIDLVTDQLVRINPFDGYADPIGEIGLNFPSVAGLAFNPLTNTLYASSNLDAANLYTIDTNTGSATLVGPLGLNMPSLAYVPNEDTLYGASGETDSLYKINVNTGQLTLVGPLGVGISFNGLTYFAKTDTLYLSWRGGRKLFSLNRTTGAATEVGAFEFSGVNGLASDNLNP